MIKMLVTVSITVIALFSFGSGRAQAQPTSPEGLGKTNAGRRNTSGVPKIEMVRIPAGSFIMGATDSTSENQGDDVETPHRVTISRSFYIGKFEVTQAQWKAVSGRNPSNPKGDKLPVNNVSWKDIQIFIKKLNSLQKIYRYRLPTEAEWEYAARAGTTTIFSFGNNEKLLEAYAWFSDNTGTTRPVGTKKPNPWGLFDVHGNVYELCQDWYGKYPSASVTDPTGPARGQGRVMRGGSLNDEPSRLSSAARDFVGSEVVGNLIGFRLAADKL